MSINKKAHTKRDKEIFQIFTADRTAGKLEENAEVNDIYFLNSLAVRRKDVYEGKEAKPELIEQYIKFFFKNFEGKELQGYRRMLKSHLKRLKITYDEWRGFHERFLFNAIIDRIDEDVLIS